MTTSPARSSYHSLLLLPLLLLLALLLPQLPTTLANTEIINFKLELGPTFDDSASSAIRFEDVGSGVREGMSGWMTRDCIWQPPTRLRSTHLLSSSPNDQDRDLCTEILTPESLPSGGRPRWGPSPEHGEMSGFKSGSWSPWDDWLWMSGGMYTARVSWPATRPANFRLSLEHTLEPLPAPYLRISINSTSVPIPRSSPLRLSDPSRPVNPRTAGQCQEEEEEAEGDEDLTIPFHLIVEPLLFGFIPATAIPTVVAVLFMAGIGWRASRWIIRFIEELARGPKRWEPPMGAGGKRSKVD